MSPFKDWLNLFAVSVSATGTRVCETRTVTGSDLFSLLTCPHTTTFALLSIFSPLETSSIKIWETIRSWRAKCSFPVAVRVSKTRVLYKLPIVCSNVWEVSFVTTLLILMPLTRKCFGGLHLWTSFISYIPRFSHQILLCEKAFRILLRPVREAKRVSHTWKNRFVQSQTTVEANCVFAGFFAVIAGSFVGQLWQDIIFSVYSSCS